MIIFIFILFKINKKQKYKISVFINCYLFSRDAEREEDAWLEALEKGELDDAGGLKKEKGKSLKTARQVSLLCIVHF